jgi:mannose-6-phosphate isomerase-like protein (cupin superfamily)
VKKFILCTFAAFCLLSAQTKKTVPAVHISAADIQTTLKKAPADSVTDQQIRMIEAGSVRVGVGVVHRSAKAEQTSISHDELTEIYHILAGSGTLVTDGTLNKTQRIPPDSATVKDLAGPSLRGSDIANGTSQNVRAGDVVIIPAGTPHYFSKIDGAIDYEVMRVDPGRLLSLK